MWISYLKLAAVALFPVILTAILVFLDRKTKFQKLPYMVNQVIYGILFGGLAVIGTEFGVPMANAQANCRDAAVIAAGLFFGAPAGIIAGLIGGIERWFAVYWGISEFTRVACSVSTIVAGLVSAWLRNYFFEKKRPAWLLAFVTGSVIETFHLTMIFVTNMAEPTKAIAVVQTCFLPMTIANGVSVMLSAIVIALISREKVFRSQKKKQISQKVQAWMFIVVMAAFLITSAFMYRLQNQITDYQVRTSLDDSAKDAVSDIRDRVNDRMIERATEISGKTEILALSTILVEYNVTEINLIDRRGIIAGTSNSELLGYDMKSGAQSEEFLCLLSGTESYVQGLLPTAYDENLKMKYCGVATENGFVQIGYNEKRYHQAVEEVITDLAANRHVGRNGFVLILDEKGNVLSAPRNYQRGMFSKEDLLKVREDETYSKIPAEEENYLAHRERMEDYLVYSFLPESEAYESNTIAIYVNTFLEILVFAVLFVLIFFIIRRVIVKPTQRINASLSKITEGQLDERVDVRNTVEFDSLSNDINATVDTLNRYIREAEERINAELAFAKAIQFSSLPDVKTVCHEDSSFDLAAFIETAKEVGGDFYDFYMTGSDKLNLLIADGSGIGIPAAMFMMRAKTELRTLKEAGHTLSEVFTIGNEALCDGNDAGMFVTAWQAEINLQTGEVKYVNAGHNPPVLKTGGGDFDYLRGRAGFVLAGMEGVKYKEASFWMNPEDILYLYTDGITEATSLEKELFSEARLLETLNQCKDQSMDEICQSVKAATDVFVGEAPQFDDMTQVAFRLKK